MVADRGQLLLVGAILFSVVVVGVVVQLNDLQYTDSMASDAETEAIDRAAQTEAETRDALAGLVTRVRADTGRDEFDDALRENVSTYQNYSRNMTAAGGAIYTNVSVNETASENFSEVSQSGGNFKAGSEGTWTLANDTEAVNEFWLNVTNAPDPSTDFVLKVKNDSHVWQLYINKNPPGFDIQTSTAGATGRDPICTESSADLNLVNGSSADGDCEFTPFQDDLHPPYNISIQNGGAAIGDFRIIMYGDVDETNVSPTDAGIYAPAIDYQYRSPSTWYNRTFVVGGGGS